LVTGGRSKKTELVTIGGTGSKRNQDFKRLKEDYEVHSDFVATHPYEGGDERALGSAV
jgi:hypothetical protein